MAQSYGIPYTGNKQKIAEDILSKLPRGKRLVDLFGGGGAITHYAMVNYPYKWGGKFLYNDINPLVVDLFRRAVNGEFNPKIFKPKFITRQEFLDNYETDGYIKYIWSFGNSGNQYLFGKHLEEFKHKAHDYVVFGDEDCLQYLEEHFKDTYYWHIKDIYQGEDYRENRKRYVPIILKIEAIRVCVEYGDKQVYDEYKDLSFDEFLNLNSKDLCRTIDKYCPLIPKKNYHNSMDKKTLIELKQLEQLQRLERLERLEKLEQLQQLQQLQRLEKLEQLQQLQQLQRLEKLEQQTTLTPPPTLEITNTSYEDYEYQEGDVVYCDIPYENTSINYGGFDHQKFFKWCNEQPYDIYFSEYTKGEVVMSKQIRAMKGSKRFECLMKI